MASCLQKFRGWQLPGLPVPGCGPVTSGVGVGQKIRLLVLLGIRLRLHPKTFDSLRLRPRNPGKQGHRRAGALPPDLSKRWQRRQMRIFHNSIIGVFMVCQDQIEKNFL